MKLYSYYRIYGIGSIEYTLRSMWAVISKDASPRLLRSILLSIANRIMSFLALLRFSLDCKRRQTKDKYKEKEKL